MKSMSAYRRPAIAAIAATLASGLALTACSSSPSSTGSAAATSAATGGDTGTASGSGGKMIDVSMTQFQGSFATLLVSVANRKGFFADNGINAKIVQVANGTAASAAVLSGSVDMSTNSVYEILAAQSKGEDLEYIAGGVKGGFGEIVTAPGLNLPDASKGFPAVLQDLKGKSIGVSSIGAGTYYELLFLLQKAGMTAKDVTIVPAGSEPSSLAALKAGRLQAFMAQEPVTSQLLADKDGKVVYSLGNGPNPPAGSENLMPNGLVATKKWIDANPQAVKDVNAAITQANSYLQGLDQSGANTLAGLLAPDLPGIPASVVATAVLNYKDRYDNDMAPQGIAIANQQLIQAGIIKTAVPYKNLVDSIAQEG
jgi:NitT/TauT family transport system substrate-binding protein